MIGLLQDRIRRKEIAVLDLVGTMSGTVKARACHCNVDRKVFWEASQMARGACSESSGCIAKSWQPTNLAA